MATSHRQYIDLELDDDVAWQAAFDAGLDERQAAGVVHEVVFTLGRHHVAVILTWASIRGSVERDIMPGLPWPAGSPARVRRVVPLGPVD
jgi:hypothetical protein